MTVKEERFLGGYNPVSGQQILMIVDYRWWTDNETVILEWMDQSLPRGRDHQTGMVLSFDTDEELAWFLMRWA